MNGKKYYIFFILAILAIIVLFFLTNDTNDEEYKGLGEFSGLAIPTLYTGEWKDITDGSSSSKENENVLGQFFDQLVYAYLSQDTLKCIENKETHYCYFLNSILNNKSENCNNFPEVYISESCGSGGCHEITRNYRDSCFALVKLYNEFENSENKKQVCYSFSGIEDINRDRCITYLALKTQDETICTLSTRPYWCYHNVLCDANGLKSYTDEFYECQKKVCDLNYQDYQERVDCRELALKYYNHEV